MLGICFLKSAGLVTGGVAGIALLVSYLVPLPVGVLFTLINIPFFLFAYPAHGQALYDQDGHRQPGHYGPGRNWRRWRFT